MYMKTLQYLLLCPKSLPSDISNVKKTTTKLVNPGKAFLFYFFFLKKRIIQDSAPCAFCSERCVYTHPKLLLVLNEVHCALF